MDLSSGKEQGVVIIGKIRTIKGRKFGRLTVIDLAYIKNHKTFNGKTVTQWAEENKLNPKLVNQRIRSGWSLKKALDPTKHINQFK